MLNQAISSNEYLHVMIQGLDFVFNDGNILKVIRNEKISPVPLSPKNLLGVINYQSTIVPVFAIFLEPKDEFNYKELEYYEIIIFSIENTRIGILPNSITGLVEDLEISDKKRKSKKLKHDWITNSYKKDEKDFYEIDILKLWEYYLSKDSISKEKENS